MTVIVVMVMVGVMAVVDKVLVTAVMAFEFGLCVICHMTAYWPCRQLICLWRFLCLCALLTNY